MGNTLFKGKMNTPTMGVPPKDGDWWSPSPWQPGQVPGHPRGSGFNPVYKANQTNPPKKAEVTDNFALHKKDK